MSVNLGTDALRNKNILISAMEQQQTELEELRRRLKEVEQERDTRAARIIELEHEWSECLKATEAANELLRKKILQLKTKNKVATQQYTQVLDDYRRLEQRMYEDRKEREALEKQIKALRKDTKSEKRLKSLEDKLDKLYRLVEESAVQHQQWTRSQIDHLKARQDATDSMTKRLFSEVQTLAGSMLGLSLETPHPSPPLRRLSSGSKLFEEGEVEGDLHSDTDTPVQDPGVVTSSSH